MRNLKLFLAAFVLMLTTSTFANTTSGFEDAGTPISSEIEKMLKASDLIIDESFTVKVFFTVTDDKRITVHKVSSPNEEVNEFLMKRLNHQKLHGESWTSKQVYELPVKVHSRR